jgi:hypothetical protein
LLSVNSDENREDDYIEFTLLLHCKLETKKNARVFDFSGVLEFLDEFRMITFFLSSSIITDLLKFS